jgi:formate hydrogenlyase subunit 3/multisubunit Na+/H+ antiporter MnhD subunit
MLFAASSLELTVFAILSLCLSRSIFKFALFLHSQCAIKRITPRRQLEKVGELNPTS